MKVKYKDLVFAMSALNKISELEMKVSDAVKVANLINIIRNELIPFEETKITLCKKYGRLEPDGQTYTIPEMNTSNFASEYNNLHETEIDFTSKPFVISTDIYIDAKSILAHDKFITFSNKG